ncbi:craniofacial development protein 2-like [Sinocyclocheilus grahami]|uniref:craniofacial development protein 2-like n=1 Tax=Sinocyclocheilus grahami TaxID=75366 RepID=UPI0007ACF18F|nr:PREDICTED: craniofacial development protein 2-like [Sinocyclocheilus grahami]
MYMGRGQLVSDEKIILYSGHDSDHARGVGLVLLKKEAAALLSWKPISDRLISAHLHTRHVKITVIQAYAPIEDAVNVSKDAFYDQLQHELDSTPRHDLVMMLGNLNGQIGDSRRGFERTICPHGSARKTNDNGERFISLCTANALAVDNTYFAHQMIHKRTWRSPDGSTLNDYVCITGQWRSSLLDIRAFRGADIGSNHNLVVAKCQLWIKRVPTQPRRPRPFDLAKLKDLNMATQFQIELRNRFEALADLTDIEQHWTGIQEAFVARADLTVGRRRGMYRE